MDYGKGFKHETWNGLFFGMLVLALIMLSGCAGGSLSTREMGALIGAGSGAGVGAIIGGATGHPGAGAAIGGALGLGAGALIGDQLQGRDNEQLQQDQFNPQDLVGLREEDAIRNIESQTIGSRRCITRVMRRDGEWFPATRDYRYYRVNLEIDRGIVTRAYIA